jgi:glutathione S-transferase
MTLQLISHRLCPYVQRAAIALAEKGVPYQRTYVDLADKPKWFRDLSPLGKVPLIKVTEGDRVTMIFESAVILEYLEETQPAPLHPADALERARHRSWIEFGSSILNGIARLYNARTKEDMHSQANTLSDMFARVEHELRSSPWFAGNAFSLVDAVYGPIFRYFDTFDNIADFGVFDDTPKVSAWRLALAARPSIQQAVEPDYSERLMTFLHRRDSALSTLVAAMA